MTIPFLTAELKKELDIRLEKVTGQIREQKASAYLIGGSANMFYLSGAIFRGYIYVMPERKPLFFMIRPSIAPDMENTFQIHKPENILSVLEEQGYGRPEKIGLEFSDMLYSDILRLKVCFPDSEAVDASSGMRKARMTKTDYEIMKMKEDGVRHVAVYSQIDRCYKAEMTDLEFQIEIERVLRREGCLGFLRAAGSRMEINMGSVLCGDNADVPSPYDFSMGGAGTDPSLPVGANGTTMLPSTAVMVDMNGGFNGYQTDMTRCWTVGPVSELAVRAHECSRRILRELEKMARPGVPVADLFKCAVEIAREEKLHEYFMGHANHVKFIGHGVGIELNELPVVMESSKQLLEENMTIALEPKFVIPHVGALGVENTYRVTSDGLENLTPFSENLSEL